MSPARLHRERLAASSAMPSPTPIVANAGGGQPTMPDLTPASEHRLALAMAAAAASGGPVIDGDQVIDPIAAQMKLRLAHDLRRLKEIQSIELKVKAKREMLPEYRDWCDHLLKLGREAEGKTLAATGADDVLPIMMVWSIDAGDWPRAIELATFVLDFDVPLPARYVRAAPSLLAEEVAVAAIKLQGTGAAFPLDVLERVEAMTADADMHDEIRAKLMKAIGFELTRQAEAIESGTPEFVAAAERALAPLRRAQALHDRVGAKDKIKRLERALAPPKPPKAGTPPAA